MIEAGRLDQRIQIETPVTSSNELNEEVPGWAPDCEVSARVMETPGREFVKGDFRAEEKIAFQIRFRILDSTARIKWGGRTWRIDSVTGTRRSGETWLHCSTSEGAN